jgi:hypothetical protein
LKSVDFTGSTFTTVPVSAFNGCIGLTSITLPTSITFIGNSAFSGCTGLTSITLPTALQTFDNNAFNGCTGLTSITLPLNVSYIGNQVFAGCSAITRYNLYPLVAPYISATPFGSYAKPLHIKAVGTSGYNVSPWTWTPIFSSIIQDL